MPCDDAATRRIVLIAHDSERHKALRELFAAARLAEHALAGIALFSDRDKADGSAEYSLDSAFSIDQSVALVRAARTADRPYAIAIIEMPEPEREGFTAAARIWEEDPEIQIVIAAADPECALRDLQKHLVYADRFVVLRSPLARAEVRQLADVLFEKWRLTRLKARRLQGSAQSVPEPGRRADDAAAAPLPDEQTRHRNALVEALRGALERGELSLHYQPLVDIESRGVVGFEALLGWQHPKFGWVASSTFMPVAKLSGLVVPIGQFVLRTVCEQIVRWRRERVPVVPVAVNVCGEELASGQFEALVRQSLERAGVEPNRLALEVTERVFGRHALAPYETLGRLRSIGVSIHLDDFGGDACLSDISGLPVDTVKISRKLITKIGTNLSAEELVCEILTLTRCLGLRAVAVGVETPHQVEMLHRHGCEAAQGFHFCRPLPADECPELLSGLTTRPGITDTLRIRLASIEPPLSALPGSSALDLAERQIASRRSR